MCKETKKEGVVYALRNESVKGINIGSIEGTDIASRVEQLSGESVPEPYKVVTAVRVADHMTTREIVHMVLKNCRMSEEREFFDVSPEKASEVITEVAGLSVCGGTFEYVEGRKKQEPEDNEEETVEAEAESEPAKIRKKSRKAGLISDLGLEKGSIISLELPKAGGNMVLSARIEDDHHIKCYRKDNGGHLPKGVLQRDVYTMSGLAKKVFPTSVDNGGKRTFFSGLAMWKHEGMYLKSMLGKERKASESDVR